MNDSALLRLDFNLLLDFDALLREGSVAGAARALHLSAPAMSRRLNRLREAMGDPLFVPAGRGLAPTPRALAMRERVHAAILEVRGIFTSAELDLSQLRRCFTLRTNDGFAGAWATRLASVMAAQAPGASLSFMARTDRNIEPLRSGAVDLDIGVPAGVETEMHHELLFEAGFVGVVREGHPLALAGADVSAREFVKWPHISASGRVSAASRIDAALEELGLQRRVAIVAPGFQAALVMAAASDFVTAMPEPYARWAKAHHRLHLFQLPIATPAVQVCQNWHLRNHADPVQRWLREQVRALCLPAAQEMLQG
jgi:DNA-binding transcriptional LysR family regulator